MSENSIKELKKTISKLQSERDKAEKKAIFYAAKLYELGHKSEGIPNDASEELVLKAKLFDLEIENQKLNHSLETAKAVFSKECASGEWIDPRQTLPSERVGSCNDDRRLLICIFENGTKYFRTGIFTGQEFTTADGIIPKECVICYSYINNPK